MEHSEISEQEVAQYWDQNAALWADHVRRGWDAFREHFNNPAMLEFIGDVDGKRVLDAGCGEGYNTRLLAGRGARMVGVDISPRMIEFARQEERREPLGIRYEMASFSDLAVFGDASFDLVVSFMALMDGPDFEGAVEEISRVLLPGGELIYSITHPCFATRGFGWTHDEEGNVTGLTVADYFDDRSWVERWKFSQAPSPEDVALFAVPRFPRTLSQYLNALVGAGFVLKAIEEPRPSEALCQQHPWLQRWRHHGSLFLYVRAAKPSAD
jgi:SAM-dependent methyltransferase